MDLKFGREYNDYTCEMIINPHVIYILDERKYILKNGDVYQYE